MNNVATRHAAKSGKTFTRVVFLMAQNPYSDQWEPMAVFPDIYWDYEHREWTCYQHVGQHSACCKAYALLDCKAPTKRQMKAVLQLKNELEHLSDPYVLTVLDTTEWLKENAALTKQYARNMKHYELSAEEEETSTTQVEEPTEAVEQMEFMNLLLDDGFSETQKEISAMFDDEFGELATDGDTDYSDISDELVYPPLVIAKEPNLAEELKAIAA